MLSAKVYVYQTVRFINQAETQVGFSDPIILNEKIIAQQIKGTIGITE